MSQPINLMASLRDLSPKGGKAGSKMAIQIKCDDLWFDPDDKPLARAIANACVAQIKACLELGQAPSGKPLPALSGRTLARRDYESEQGTRNGAAADRYSKSEFRYQVKANFDRDYTAAKLGRFSPVAGGPRGVLSGMLFNSFSARANKSGKGVTVYVAAKRGTPRPASEGRAAESVSALESVFAGVPVWDRQAMGSPRMRAAIGRSAAQMIGLKRTTRADWVRLARELSEAAQNIGDAAEYGDD